jgi:ATP-dependent DNA helicase RecG
MPPISPQEFHNILHSPEGRNLEFKAASRAGLVERSGQGLNLMLEQAIKQTKPLPDFCGSGSHEVRLTLKGTVQHPSFLRYLQRLGDERVSQFSTHDFLTLHAVHQDQDLSAVQADRVAGLIDCGAVEKVGKGKSARHLLSKELYAEMGELGTYTRKLGLDRDTNQALLFKHIRDNDAAGSPFNDLRQVLPSLSDDAIRWLLQRLLDEHRIEKQGNTKALRYHITEKERGAGLPET